MPRALLFALPALIVYLALAPRYKVLIAFVVMTSCFDLAPNVLGNWQVWDFGAMLLFIAWLQLMLQQPINDVPTTFFMRALMAFAVWMFACLAWGLLVYRYPLLQTLKASRQMILGLLSTFVFLRLFRVDPNGFRLLFKSLYLITLALLPVCVAQYLLHRPLFAGLVLEYDGAIRALPIFLPLCLLNMAHISSRFLAGERAKWHEILYVALTAVITALTFTRSIYIAVLLSFVVLLFLLGRARRLNSMGVTAFIAAAGMCVLGLATTGGLDRVAGRFLSGISILTQEKPAASAHDIDTFSGRLALVAERMELVIERNPLVGFAFIHEDNVPQVLRDKLRHGSVIYTPEYVERYSFGAPYVLSLHSADTGWADLVLNTGLVGMAMFLLMLGALLSHQLRNRFHALPAEHLHHALAFYLQIVVLALLMFSGNAFIVNVQIAALMIAGYTFCSTRQSVATDIVAAPRAAPPNFVDAHRPALPQAASMLNGQHS